MKALIHFKSMAETCWLLRSRGCAPLVRDIRVQEYYDLKKNWRKVKRHIGHPDVEAILVRDFNRYTWGRWRKKFQPGMVPHKFEYCDWCCGHRGPMPKFWQYTKHSACHWLVNFSLRLAERVEPDRPWRIITSDSHSTVWDGYDLLFDFNLQAMGSHPERYFDLAYYGSARAELLPGELLDVYFAEHWKQEQKRLEKEQKGTDGELHLRSVVGETQERI